VEYVLLYIEKDEIFPRLMICLPNASRGRGILDISIWAPSQIVANQTLFGPGDVFISAIQIVPTGVNDLTQIAFDISNNIRYNHQEETYKEIKSRYEVPNPIPEAQIAGIALKLLSEQTGETPELVYEEYMDSIQDFH